MKESMSMTTILQIVILFILLFAGIMALTINNSNAFGIKDEIVNIIEKSNGTYLNETNEELSQDIKDSLAEASYRTTGKCPDEFIGFDRSGKKVDSNENASICIREVNATDGLDSYLKEKLGNTVATGDFVPGSYYQIVVFFQLDIPVVKQIYNFQTMGETKIIYG